MEPIKNEATLQQESTAARVAARTEQRSAQITTLRQHGGMARADDPVRVATRIDRLSHQYPDVRPVDPAAIVRGDESAMTAAGAILERIVLTDDLLGVGYLECGVVAARAVGRVNIRDERGRLVGYGTGSLVAPGLLLTNHHVLPDAPTAGFSGIEFNYQDGSDGLPLAIVSFGFDPDTLYLSDPELDFALVAVRATPADLAPFGTNQLIGSEGKAIVGDFVTIVQHPLGGKKQVALRENRVVDVLDLFLHYATDTQPGSSGSPVFNDQWEIVALHHAGVPAPGHTELGGIVNEGLRVSRLISYLKNLNVNNPLLTPIVGEVLVPTPLDEAVNPDYRDREGYDPGFLSLEVKMPGFVGEDASEELRYHHFSVVLNRRRRLALCTAVNIDGTTSARLKREPDHWILDPRVPTDWQTGEAVYADNPLDRGHLVRRLDPAWGVTRMTAKAANDDTFHFTNCTPQHKDFNQGQTLWAGLEDYILENADNLDLKVTVFTGPVLATDDDEYRGVQLPRQYWKVVAMVRTGGTLSATAYLLSQASLIKGLESAEPFSYGAYRTFQVPVATVESLTGLSFGLPSPEALSVREIDRLDDITL
jgi:endonuclease G